jgi:glycosyltransferase involved in cell wall biosynthesis
VLNGIASQKQNGYKIEKIILCSDGSTDKTVEESKKLQIPYLDVIDGKIRKGQSARMREIIDRTTTDFLLFLDADILIADENFLHKLLTNRDGSKYDLIAGERTPLPGITFFEKSINHGIETIQKVIRKKWKNGNNYLAFNGRCLLLSKNIYSSMSLPSGLINMDAYIYFYAKNNALKMKHSSLSIYYRSPSCYKDYLSQALRFRKSYDELSDYFPKEILIYKIPKKIVFQTFLQSFFQNPVLFISYMSIYFVTQTLPARNVSALWRYNISTKKIFASA